jgi:hypothetical protein
MTMDAKDLKIARLEREQKKLVSTLGIMLDSIKILVPYCDVDRIPRKELIVFLQNQKTAVLVLGAILEGE